MSNNPFSPDYKRQIDMRDQNTAMKNSFQQTVVINNRRAKGNEPSLPYSEKGRDTEPKKFAIPLPVMAKFDENAAARRRRAEKKGKE
jgi:hypothetical protein